MFNLKYMIVVNTPNIEGKRIVEYKGVITSDVIAGAFFVRDFFAMFRDFIGGRSMAYENVLAESKKEAMKELLEAAEKLGANAIVGLKFDFETVGGKGSMFLVHLTATAVVVE